VLAVLAFAGPQLPEYRPGDVATGDIVTPVTIRVVDPEFSAALKNESAAGVPLIFRHVVTIVDEVESDLLANIEKTRTNFLAALRQALLGRIPQAGDEASLEYAQLLREASWAEQGMAAPLARFAPLWVRGASDAALVDALLQPVREVMAQPIVYDQAEEPLSVDQPIRIFRVKSLLEAPGFPELKTGGQATLAAHLSGLESARSAAESYFPPEQQDMAWYAAGFLRANTFPAPGLTELLRAQSRDEAIGYETYAAGQIILRKGQTIDPKTLAALAALRDKQHIDALLTKVDTDQSVATLAFVDTQEFLKVYGAAGLVVLLLLWLWGRRGSALPASAERQPVELLPALWSDEDAENWRSRAVRAERRADRAQEAVRQGALGWMRDKMFRSLFHQRADLLATQQRAEAEMVELEQRMAQLLVPLQDRIRTYEKRIRELEEMQADPKGATRRLIDARINRARQQLELERAQAERGF
jgi:7TM-HD extracellular